MKRNKKQCPSCKEMVSLSNFDRHTGSKSCKNGGKNRTKAEQNPWKDWLVDQDLYELPCGYRGTKRSCRSKLIADKIAKTKGNTNLQSHIAAIKDGTKQVHNKGKATPPEQRKKISAAIKKFYKDVGASPETRALLSRIRKEYMKTHPEAHANARVAGNRKKMTYPEQVAHDWFQKNEIQAVHNQRVGKYFPDFLVGTTIVEIDGERWHSSPEQVARDKKRDAELTAMGYEVHRIMSKSNIEERLEELFSTQYQLGRSQAV